MDCIQMLQESIAFMEAHILEPINYADVAKHLYVSNYHFHHIFSMFTGYTANEYLRFRRLSMAGQELILSDAKIIDLAYKYCYDTPESFTRAFTRFHGVSPMVAKRSGTPLKSFNRLILKIKLEGGTILNYRIEERKPFYVLAKVRQFSNEIISQMDNHDIPDFWDECSKTGVWETLGQHCHSLDTYGICSPVSKESNYFQYGIGKLYEGGPVPDGYTVWEVKPTLWAVFECHGTNGDCIGAMWDRIHTEFLPCSDYNMMDDTDFERYPSNAGDLFCEIWIPVEHK